MKNVNKMLGEWCLGKSMGHAKLRAPTSDAGLAQPLKDVRYVNIAIMLRGVDGEEPCGGLATHMGAHRAWAARLYREWTGLLPWRKEQKVLLQKLTLSCHEPILAMATTMGQRKKRHGWPKQQSAKELTRRVIRNTRQLPAKMAPVLRNHLFQVLHGILPTNGSWVPKKGEEHEGPAGCELCGDKKVRETTEHLFVQCRVTKAAIKSLVAEAKDEDRRKLGWLLKAKIQDYDLRTYGMSQERIILTVVLSRAVWRARWDCKGSRLNFQERQRQVMVQFKKASKWAKGGGRRSRDREVEVHDFREMRSALPPAHHAYTDGSAFKYTDYLRLVEMTGPSGCGVFLVMQDGQELFRSRHLGVGTSAVAEVQGMALAAEVFMENEPEDDLPLYFFTDSRAAIKAATGAKTPWWCAEEALRLRELVRTVAETRRVVCFWVPAHAGLRENEVVDRLARRGATGVDSDAGATPDDEHGITKEELVVATALGRRDIDKPVPLDGPSGVLPHRRGPRAERTLGVGCGGQGMPGLPVQDTRAEDAPT
jgi:ribonuclease HI